MDEADIKAAIGAKMADAEQALADAQEMAVESPAPPKVRHRKLVCVGKGASGRPAASANVGAVLVVAAGISMAAADANATERYRMTDGTHVTINKGDFTAEVGRHDVATGAYKFQRVSHAEASRLANALASGKGVKGKESMRLEHARAAPRTAKSPKPDVGMSFGDFLAGTAMVLSVGFGGVMALGAFASVLTRCKESKADRDDMAKFATKQMGLADARRRRAKEQERRRGEAENVLRRCREREAAERSQREEEMILALGDR